MNLVLAQFLRTALECSIYHAPRDPGLTQAELFEVGNKAGFQEGEIGDALPYVAVGQFGKSAKLMCDPEPFWAHITMRLNPEFRNIDAYDFMYSQINMRLKSEGKRAQFERSVLVARAVDAKIPMLDIEAAIAMSIIGEVLIERDGLLSSKHGLIYDPLPSAQPVHPWPVSDANKAMRQRAYLAVKDVIDRRTDGRPKHAEPLEAFSDALDRLGHGPFRLWWTQMVAELRHTDAQFSPVSSLVMAAALVEGALTFCVSHARAKQLGVFRSKDFEGEPKSWKLDALIKSAAYGGEAAVLNEPTRSLASALAETRQRIHAGRMLSTFPHGVPDLRPEEARAAKATAEKVVRQVLIWLEKYPPG
jgi:hypothetical protein